MVINMCEYNNVPKIRFKGFTDVWEQRKLGEVFVEYSEKNHEELPALMIIQGGGTIRRDESDRSLLYDKANLSNYKMVKEGDFIVHLRSFEGGLEKATNTGIISPAYHTFHGENTDSRFYYSYFRSKKFIDIDLKPHVYGIRDGRSIDIEGMKTIKIPSTSYEEQKAIGTFIEHLDILITLHQRKCDTLVNAKKSLLEKMFPKNSSNIPEIRFKEFTDVWEQRKYKDIGIPLSGGNLSYDSLDDDGDKKCVLYGDLYTKYDCIIQDIKNRTFEVGNSIIKNDILFPQSTTVDAYSLISPACLNEENAETSGVFVIRPYKNINGNFICYYTKGNIEQRKKLSKKAQGLTIVHLYYHSIKEESIMIPHKDEQDKIASVLLDLDNLITLHQRKLEKLKNIKKSMLDKMFV